MCRFLACLFCLTACAAQQNSSRAINADGVIAVGGDIRVSDMPAANTEVLNGQLVVWGEVQAPGNSRMQAAQALAAAAARAELLKLMRVEVASLELDITTDERQQLEVATAEVVQGKLRTSLVQHGWQKVQRGNETVLRLVGRLTVGREDFQAALIETLGPSRQAIVDGLVGRLFLQPGH